MRVTTRAEHAVKAAAIELGSALAEPDWTVQTVAELEREIEDYCKRANEAMAKADSAATGACASG